MDGVLRLQTESDGRCAARSQRAGNSSRKLQGQGIKDRIGVRVSVCDLSDEGRLDEVKTVSIDLLKAICLPVIPSHSTPSVQSRGTRYSKSKLHHLILEPSEREAKANSTKREAEQAKAN